jgi:hypothetical protein
MRWNKVMRHWEGLARYHEVLTLANEHGGSVRRVSAPANAPASPPSSTMGGFSDKRDAAVS